MKKPLVLLVLLATLGSVLLARSVARAEVLDRIVAVLDDDAIFLSDLERRARPLMAGLPQVTDPAERQHQRDQALHETLDQMIDDALIRRAAPTSPSRRTRSTSSSPASLPSGT